MRLCKEEPENISLRVERHEISRRGKGGGGGGGEGRRKEGALRAGMCTLGSPNLDLILYNKLACKFEMFVPIIDAPR